MTGTFASTLRASPRCVAEPSRFISIVRNPSVNRSSEYICVTLGVPDQGCLIYQCLVIETGLPQLDHLTIFLMGTYRKTAKEFPALFVGVGIIRIDG